MAGSETSETRKPKRQANKRKSRAPRVDGTIDQVDHYIRRSNPYVRTSHRINHNTVRSILGSLLTLHNESINIYSHLIPACFFLHLLYQVWHDAARAQEDHIIFALYLGSCCLLCSFSAVYHLFSAHSERVHDLVVKMDFLGIIFVIASSFVMSIWYGFYCQPFVRNLYLVFCLSIDGIMLVTPFLELDLTLRRSIYVASVCFGVVPLSHLIYLYGFNPVVVRLATMMSIYGLAFLFYITKFPERVYPHTFDVFGASHQIWHVILDVAFIYFYVSMEQIYPIIIDQKCGA